jgi:hypothetical protein
MTSRLLSPEMSMTDSVACAFTILYIWPSSRDWSQRICVRCQLPDVSGKIAAYHDGCRKRGRVRGVVRPLRLGAPAHIPKPRPLGVINSYQQVKARDRYCIGHRT